MQIMNREIDDFFVSDPFMDEKEIKASLSQAIGLLSRAFERGGKLFIAGNGGSMADALHISGELMKSFRIKRRGFRAGSLGLQPGVPVWVLGNNPSLYSAVGNDLPERGVEFAQELFAAGQEGDVLLGISTSGKADNVQKAFMTAKEMNIQTISLTGRPGEPLSGMAGIAIMTPGEDTSRIQEYHVKVYHTLCAVIEERLFGEKGRLTGLYGSRYERFDFSKVETYSLEERKNRTDLKGLVHPEDVIHRKGVPLRTDNNESIDLLAERTVQAWKSSGPVILMMGAHLIKNGLGPLVVDLIDRGIVSLVAGNGACPIHDAELALCGGTSEKVQESLPAGRFGFAGETGIIINSAYREAYKRKIGAGEALGAILAGEIPLEEPREFPYREYSIFYSAYKCGIPATIHGTIGTDIVDQHPSSSFEAKGYASGVDFSIFAGKITKMGEGGVIVNIGGAVTQPEVLLKSVSMAANIGKPPLGITTAVFDLQEIHPDDMDDEEKPGYYRRDIKSIVVRIPEAFQGEGLYIQGDHKKTFVLYYSRIIALLGEENDRD